MFETTNQFWSHVKFASPRGPKKKGAIAKSAKEQRIGELC